MRLLEDYNDASGLVFGLLAGFFVGMTIKTSFLLGCDAMSKIIGPIPPDSVIRARLFKNRELTDKNGSLVKNAAKEGLVELVGNTPMVKLPTLSKITGCTILAKCEYLNPGGSNKDRIACQIILDAETAGLLRPGDTIYEGTSGSTGISLTIIARSRGYKCVIVMPNDAASEKINLLSVLGAEVVLVDPVSIVNCKHYVNMARKKAQAHNEAHDKLKEEKAKLAMGRGFFCDQFENLSNLKAHYEHTGKELWEQTAGQMDAFLCSAGTGGTVSGISQYLKEKTNHRGHPPLVAIIDPPGSSIYNKVKHKVMFNPVEKEGTRKITIYDTITEGIGLNRMTKNLEQSLIDEAYKGTDLEAVYMSRFLVLHEGIFVGSSSCMNLVGVVKLARQLGPGHTIVTLLCDSGLRHMSKFYSNEYLAAKNLQTDPAMDLFSLKFVH